MKVQAQTKGFSHESTFNESKEWYTPRPIFEALGIDFDLDPCSPGQEIVRWIPAQIHYTIQDDGLSAKWFGNCFVNPPYGSDTPRWLARLAAHGNGIALVFARCDTRWFHKFVPQADAICFIRGRVQFVRADDALLYADGICKPCGGCGAASMLIAFGEKNAEALFDSQLGYALSVSKSAEMFRTGERFGDDKVVARRPTARPYENPPCSAESRQGLFGDS